MLANDGFSGAVSVAVIKQPVICSDLEKDRRELSKMKYRARAPSMSWGFLVVVLLALGSKMQKSEALDYSDALEKALMFYEGQRSGALPPDQRLLWRGDSALTDGDASGVDLTGGYYDAGDNVKYQLPMAFTITLLSWSVVEFANELRSAGQLQHALRNIIWGTDYFLKAITGPTQLYVQVGDPNSDHQCWERPEDMDTPRVTLQINATSPGSVEAGETAAAMAAASLALRANPTLSDATYADSLLDAAIMVFNFANTYRGTFTGACPFYCSVSGYMDELLWAAAWLYRATGDPTYLRFVRDNAGQCEEMDEFSWENKNAGVQVLLSKFFFEGEKSLETYASLASAFVCHVHPGNSRTRASYTPGGLLYVRDGANLQYVTGSTFLVAVLADYLADTSRSLKCGDTVYTPKDLSDYAKSQVDYILGENPERMSYMVGFGSSYPKQVHHRGASIVSIHDYPTHIACGEGFYTYFDRNDANPNLLMGALVGGPDSNDQFVDSRRRSSYTEPTSYINSGFVGLLARLLR